MWEASSRRSSMDGGKMCHAAFCQKSSKFCDHLKPNRQTMKVQRVESRKDSRCDASSRWRDRTQAWNVLKKSSHSSWDVLWAGCEAGHSMCVPGCLGVVTESFCVSDRSPAEIKPNKITSESFVMSDGLHFMLLTTARSVVVGTLPVKCWRVWRRFILPTSTHSLNYNNIWLVYVCCFFETIRVREEISPFIHSFRRQGPTTCCVGGFRLTDVEITSGSAGSDPSATPPPPHSDM